MIECWCVDVSVFIEDKSWDSIGSKHQASPLIYQGGHEISLDSDVFKQLIN